MTRSARFAPLLLALFAAACEAAPPPQVAKVEPPPVPPPPPIPPARWIEAGGATAVGPDLDNGTLLLLGGRRGVVKKDGALALETQPSPEPLQEVIEVATSKGRKLIARSAHGVYRFDDPLAAPVPLARSDGRLMRLGAGPGVIAVWTSGSDLPAIISVEDGSPAQASLRLPEMPLRALSFLDDKRGAGVFEGAGLAVTTDGGATWKPAVGASPSDAIRIGGLRRRGDAIYGYTYTDGPDGPIDIDAARIGALEHRAAPAGEAPILRWIRRTGRDPIEVAATLGVDASPGKGALIASHGMVARVDPETGSLLELVEFAKGKWLNPCYVGGGPKAAWIGCGLSPDETDLYDPFGVLRVTLNEEPIKLGKPEIARNGDVEMRASPSGALMLFGPCHNDEDGQACARQSDGSFKTLRSDAELLERGTGPLLDGRIVILRGVSDGDNAPEPDPAQRALSGPDNDPPAKGLHFGAIDATGRERVLGNIPFTLSRGFVRVQSPIQEGADKTLRAVIEDGTGPHVVMWGGGRETATVVKVPDATVARIHGLHGIAIGESKLYASSDGGATWAEIPAPLRVMAEAREVADEPSAVFVSDVGAKIGSALRIGWGPTPEAANKPNTEEGDVKIGGAVLAVKKPQQPGKERKLVCSSEGPAQGVPPLIGSSQIKTLLASPAAPKGTKRETSTFSSGRSGMMETVALLEEDGPDKRGEGPAKWTFKWHDAAELGGRVRSATLTPPKGASFGTNLRYASSSGAKAIFSVRSGGKYYLGRVAGTGKVTLLEVSTDLTPLNDVVFGSDKAEVLAWMRDTNLVVWVKDEAPRTIGQISVHPVRTLGEPTKEGVPVLLGSHDWSILRTFPIPTWDKGSDRPPAAPPPAIDGWARTPLLRRDLGSLPACGPKSKGGKLWLNRTSLRAEVDGNTESGYPAVYEVRYAAGEACVTSIAAPLSPVRGGSPRIQDDRKKKPAATSGPVAFVRADVAGKRAEGGDRGTPPAAVRRLKCSLDEMQ